MPAGSVPNTKMNSTSAPRSELAPFAWRLYRFGLATGGLAWICIASTLCGCSGPNGWVKNQAGRGYYHRGNYAAARSEFERALMDSPYNATYAYNVGKAMEKEGDFTGAEQMYQHALTLDPSHQPSYRGMTELLTAQGRPDEAAELLTAWTQTQPYSAASHVELAQMYRKSGNYGAAEQELNTALQIRPRYRQAINERTRLGQATGRPVRGGPYSELALTSRASQQTLQPQPGMMAATPQTSPALAMAATMPQKDPTMLGGAIQASYSHPQMATMPSPMVPGTMVSHGPVMHQANMLPMEMPPTNPTQMNMAQMNMAPANMAPANMAAMPQPSHSGWTAVEHGPVPMGQSFQQMPTAYSGSLQPTPQSLPMQPGMPASMPSPQQPLSISTPTPIPMQMSQPQPATMGVPVQHPIELGQPVPVTQAIPGFSMQEIQPTPQAELTDAPVYSPAAMPGPQLSSAPTVQAF